MSGVRILIAGGSGRIGSRLARLLTEQGEEVVVAARSTGIDTVSGVGLGDAMRGIQVVIDVTNAPSRDPEEIARFFGDSSRTLTAAGRRVGVAHHVILSVVGADEMPGSPYMRGKMMQERVVAGAGVPFTIVRATQFFEFVAQFGETFAAGGEVRVPAGRMQPIAIDDVACALAAVAARPPVNAVIELGGPTVMAIQDAVARVLAARGDRRGVIASESVSYFGASLHGDTLVPGPDALRGSIDLDAWLSRLR